MNRTLHYGLPLFEAADKPSILVDWNKTMSDLDLALFTIATGGDTSVVDAITSLQQAVSSINSQIEVINQTLGDTLDTSFMNNIANQFDDTNHYYPKDFVFKDGNLFICAEGYTPGDTFDQKFIPVWLCNKLTDAMKDAEDAYNGVRSLSSRMHDAEYDIDELDTRVTTLENVPHDEFVPNIVAGRNYTIKQLQDMGIVDVLACTIPLTGTYTSTYNFDSSVNRMYITFSGDGEEIASSSIPSVLTQHNGELFVLAPPSFNIQRRPGIGPIKAKSFLIPEKNTDGEEKKVPGISITLRLRFADESFKQKFANWTWHKSETYRINAASETTVEIATDFRFVPDYERDGISFQIDSSTNKFISPNVISSDVESIYRGRLAETNGSTSTNDMTQALKSVYPSDTLSNTPTYMGSYKFSTLGPLEFYHINSKYKNLFTV